MTEAKKPAAKKAAPKKAALVKMERDGKQADVHPGMVDHYKAGGWHKVD